MQRQASMDTSVVASSICFPPPVAQPWPNQQEVLHTQLPRLLGHPGDQGLLKSDTNMLPSKRCSLQGVLPKHKGSKANARVSALPATAAAAAPKGPISMLQEYVQSSQTFHVPSNYSVLQWSFDSQMADAATLEFRAVVAFLLEGVPHHIAGTWQAKKKDAQRDAAERALGLFVGRWGDQAFQPVRYKLPPINNARSAASGAEQLSEEELLAQYCKQTTGCGSNSPFFIVHWKGDTAQATVEMTILGVPHQFAGTARSSEAAARMDAARRVLWYLQQPGFEHEFEPDPLSAAVVNMKIPSPPVNWAHDSVEEGALEVAERKTAIMRVQNRLQQTFSHEIKPGCSVWSWNYDMDPTDEGWPVLCRASVNIPVVGKTFIGDWVRGQRDAQLDTIRHVMQLLDELETNV